MIKINNITFNIKLTLIRYNRGYLKLFRAIFCVPNPLPSSHTHPQKIPKHTTTIATANTASYSKTILKLYSTSTLPPLSLHSYLTSSHSPHPSKYKNINIPKIVKNLKNISVKTIGKNQNAIKCYQNTIQLPIRNQ